MKFIIRLFPEISIKSKPVRNRLIKMVRRNIVNVSLQHYFKVDAYSQWDKVIANFEGDDEQTRITAIRELSRIPGIHSFMEVVEFAFSTLETLFEEIKPLCCPQIEGHTFAVRVKRHGNHDFNSQQAERILGGKFKASVPNLGVNLDNPEVTIHIQIENQTCYVYGPRHLGLGGFPVGSQGEVFSLISGGFDSGVSTYLTLHRGLKVNYLFFNMGGTAHELGVKQESYFIWDRYASSHKVRFVTIPFEQVVGQILERTHHGVRGVLLKRMMIRVATLIAQRFNCEGLVTGESLAQVSSQTLTNLNHIDKVSPLLIIRPLVTMDKQQIIDLSRQIGTLGFAENMPEYCGVISDHPNVCPKEEFVLEQEALLDSDLAQTVANAARVMNIADIPENTATLKTQVEVIASLSKTDVVIDVRAPDDVQKNPLQLESNEVLELPFYKIAKDFEYLDQLKTYALYCDQGVMSIMQARQLKELGFHNVKVWRPE